MPYLSSQDEADCIGFLRELVRIPSLSGQEGRIAARIADEMRRVGFGQVYCDRAGNVVGRIGKGTQRILFNGHMDTVGIGNAAAWQHDPFGAEVIDGVLYGRWRDGYEGVARSDGLRPQDACVRPICPARRGGPGSSGAGRTLRRRGHTLPDRGRRTWPSFVVLGEPTNLEVALGHRGRVELRVTTEGRACHASAPELGENALYAAAKVIFGIEMLAGDLGEDPRLGKGSIAVTGISCTAGSNNVVPDFCELIIDRRLTLGETRERALSEVRQVIEREGVRGNVPRGGSRDGYLYRTREPRPGVLCTVADARRCPAGQDGSQGRRTGTRTPAASEGLGLLDRRRLPRGEAGIPTVGFGPGEERYAHTVNEQVRLADVLLCRQWLCFHCRGGSEQAIAGPTGPPLHLGPARPRSAGLRASPEKLT